MKLPTIISTAALTLTLTSNAAIVLQTNFDGTTASGTTLSGISYGISDGLTGDASISGSNNLFATTGDAAGHYAVDQQLNGGQWDVDLGFTVSGSPIQIESIEIERQNFNVSGGFNDSTPRTYPITVTLFGSTTGQIGTPVSLTPDPDSANTTDTYNFGGVEVDNSESWFFNVQFNDGSSTESGVYAGIDGYSINAVPEPSAILFIGSLGILFLLRRRR